MFKRAMLSISIGALILGLVFWFGNFQSNTMPTCSSGTYDGAFDGEVVVPQNWNCSERQDFWFTDQGSRIIPYAWFLHLEQANDTAKFSDSNNMDQYRYLPQNPTDLNPDGLAVGFTKGTAKVGSKNSEKSLDWLGLSCAACHTGQIEYLGKKYLIDGAPTMGDFQRLVRDLTSSMEATLNDGAKFERFAAAVITDTQTPNNNGPDDVSRLRDQLAQMTAFRRDWVTRNRVTNDYGHARLDAVGIIVNEIAASGLGTLANITPPNAPVSYPFIWDTPHHDKVQWNGSVSNAGLGVLTRNFTEVLGVFGSLEIAENNETVLSSSVNPAGLAKLEELLSRLQSPLWTDTGLPVLDIEMVNSGRKVFDKFCAECHRDIDDRTDPARHVEGIMIPIFNPNDPTDPDALATDITMAKNFLTKISSAPGLISGAVKGSIVQALLAEKEETLNAIKAGQPPDIVTILDAAAEQHLAGTTDLAGVAAYLTEVNSKFPPANMDPNKPACFPNGSLPCYKARPLNGIWATAPFLHNGSVRTMRQLLLPGEQREVSFKVGTREYDPDNMGFLSEGAFTFDTSLPGNSNGGHDGSIYGNVKLSDDPEMMKALIEYLKSL